MSQRTTPSRDAVAGAVFFFAFIASLYIRGELVSQLRPMLLGDIMSSVRIEESKDHAKRQLRPSHDSVSRTVGDVEKEVENKHSNQVERKAGAQPLASKHGVRMASKTKAIATPEGVLTIDQETGVLKESTARTKSVDDLTEKELRRLVEILQWTHPKAVNFALLAFMRLSSDDNNEAPPPPPPAAAKSPAAESAPIVPKEKALGSTTQIPKPGPPPNPTAERLIRLAKERKEKKRSHSRTRSKKRNKRSRRHNGKKELKDQAQATPRNLLQNDKRKVTIVDSIMYNGEPVVPVRLELLYPIVDHFYITESTLTHSGRSKPFYMKLHRDLFQPYEDKITWLVYEPNKTQSDGNWDRENQQRKFALNAMRRDLEQGQLRPPFVILNTDGDEMPNPEILKEFQPGKAFHPQVLTEPMMLKMDWFCYNLNWKKHGDWHLGHTLPGEMTIDGTYSLQSHRKDSRAKRTPKIPNAGWHTTYFLGVDGIQNKLKSFAHQEYNKDRFKSREHIEDCIRNGNDLFNRKYKDEQMTRFDYKSLPLPLQKFHEQVVQEQNVTIDADVSEG